MIQGHKKTHYDNFAGVLASSDLQLVDCGLCDLCSLLSFIQVMLDFPEPDCATAHMLLLADSHETAATTQTRSRVKDLWLILLIPYLHMAI